MRSVDHHIAGARPTGGTTPRTADVYDPNTGAVQARVALGDSALLDHVVAAAQAAQPAWAATNPQRRARVMFRFKELVEAHMDELAHLLSSEHGKVLADSKGDIQRGLEVIEFACGIPHVLKGECIRTVRGRGSTSIRCGSRSGPGRGSPRSTSRR